MSDDRSNILDYQNHLTLPHQPLPKRILARMAAASIATLIGVFIGSYLAIGYCEVLYKDDIPLYYAPGKSERYCIEYPFLAGVVLLLIILTAGLVAALRRPPGRGSRKNILIVLLLPSVSFVILFIVMMTVLFNVFTD